MRPPRARVFVTLLLLVAACTSTTTTTTVPSTTTLPPSLTTTTTEPELCPDAFCIVYTLKPDLSWSDGEPLTAADFAYTLTLLTAEGGPATGNPGYDLVTSWEVIDPVTFMVVMSEVYAPWQTLFEIVFPAHIDYDEVHPGPSNGPFVVAEWNLERMVLERNPFYVGPESGGDVEQLSFVFSGGVRDMIADLSRGSIDLVTLTPLDWVVDEVDGLRGVGYELSPGPFWEHITLNHDDPLLSRPFFREALTMALDRERILDATVRQLDPDARPLGNTVWMGQSVFYQDHFSAAHDPGGAVELLVENGCERGADGVFVCEGDRASFIWATTVGDPLRAEQVRVARAMLAQVGIEVETWSLDPADLFSTPILFGDSRVWQLMSFAWRASADPALAESMYMCLGSGPHGMGLLNVARFCDPSVEQLIARARAELDPDSRAAIFNQVDAAYLGGFSVIPLYQRPVLLAWSELLTGPRSNPWGSDLWNVGSWAGLTEVAVGVDHVPSSLTDPLTDEVTRMIMSAIHSGAYLVTPEMEHVPVLVDRVETIVRGR